MLGRWWAAHRIKLVASWLLFVVACGSSAGAGDTERGRQLFHGEALIAGGNAPTCISCHVIGIGEPVQLGPNLSNIGNRAATTVVGQGAADYLRTSLLEPDAYLAQGFQEGIMYRGYKTALTGQQVNDLIAYMATLRSGNDN